MAGSRAASRARGTERRAQQVDDAKARLAAARVEHAAAEKRIKHRPGMLVVVR